MNNILIWLGIAALSLQDYFKKPEKTKRSQQFFQTGGTAQAFIAGTNSIWNKILKLYKKNIVVDDDGYTYLILPNSIAKKIYDMGTDEILIFYSDSESYITEEEDFTRAKMFGYKVGVEDVDYFLEKVFKKLYYQEGKEEYLKLAEIAASDWELALEIAKGQGLL